MIGTAAGVRRLCPECQMYRELAARKNTMSENADHERQHEVDA